MSLQVENISYAYGKRKVLDSVSFEVPAGKVLALLGPNGIGKTTFLKAFSRILEPQSGETIIDDIDIFKLSQLERARLIAYVPQHTNNVFPISVADAVMMGRQPFVRFRPTEKDKRMVFEIMKRLELAEFAFRNIHELSGGERQRVFIARALAQEPKLLLLDEPTSSMDIKNQLHIMSLVGDLVREKGIAAVISIHDLNLASMFCDYFLFLKDSRVFAYGKGEEVLTSDKLLSVYEVKTEVSEVDDYSHIRLLKASLAI